MNTQAMTNQKESVAAPVQKSDQLNASERFTNQVMREFSGNVSGAMNVTDYQRTLIQGYFIAIDRTLKKSEEDRIRKNSNNKDPKYNNDLPYNWQNVNLTELAVDVVHYARMGLDMMQDNMLFPIPYKNNKMQKYDVNLMEGYNGIKYIAEKYAVETPKSVTIQVVYSSDTFKPIMKSFNNKVESYEFEITNAFDRGEIVGGFAYIEYTDQSKNELIIMTMKDIMKRKPEYASANFWGGKQTTWKNGKKVEEKTDGWIDEMVRKTIIREAYSGKHMPVDPKKIDDNYQYMKMRETRYAEAEAQAEIDTHANAIEIDTSPVNNPEDNEAVTLSPIVDEETGEIIEGAIPLSEIQSETTQQGIDF